MESKSVFAELQTLTVADPEDTDIYTAYVSIAI